MNFTFILLHVVQFPAMPLPRSTHRFNSEGHELVYKAEREASFDFILTSTRLFTVLQLGCCVTVTTR